MIAFFPGLLQGWDYFQCLDRFIVPFAPTAFQLDLLLLVNVSMPAIFAWFMYRRVQTRLWRLGLVAVVIYSILLMSLQALKWIKPDWHQLLHHPIGTLLGWGFAMLVIWIFVADAQRNRSAKGNGVREG